MRAQLTVERLRDLYPAVTELVHESPFQLLIATILSAQTTDRSVNQVTPILFGRYPAALDLAGADPAEVEKIIKATGFFRTKTRRIIAASRTLVEQAVDTHVTRLTNRLGLVKTRVPEKIEAQVTRMVPPSEWTALSLRLILHGRRVCVARRPRCEECVLNDFCPSSCTRPKRGSRQK